MKSPLLPAARAVLFLFASTTLDAQTSDAVRLTLADALARGATASHRIEEMRAREDAAAADVAAREAAARPAVSLAGGYTRTSHIEPFGVVLPNGQTNVIFPDIPDNFRSRIDGQWALYTGGRLESLARAAGAELTAAGKDINVAASDLRLDISRAFWSSVTGDAQVSVLEEAVRRMDAHLAAIRSRFDAGLVPPNDVLSVEAQRSRQQLGLLEARNTREVAKAELRRLTGLSPDAPLELEATLEPRPSSPAAAAELAAEALRARPERQALESRVAAFHARRDAAAAGKRPTIALVGGVDYARPNPRILPRTAAWRESWDVSLNASWSLWDGGRTAADVATADATERAAQQRLEEFDSVVQLEVRQRRLDLESALAAIDVAGDAVRSATEARRVVANRFDAGVAESTDVLDAQVALLQAELDRTRALANAQLAQARLERAVGR